MSYRPDGTVVGASAGPIRRAVLVDFQGRGVGGSPAQGVKQWCVSGERTALDLGDRPVMELAGPLRRVHGQPHN